MMVCVMCLMVGVGWMLWLLIDWCMVRLWGSVVFCLVMFFVWK